MLKGTTLIFSTSTITSITRHPTNIRSTGIKKQYSFWSAESSVSQFIAHHENAVQAAARTILDTGSRIIGFSAIFTTLHFSLELARRIKLLCPEAMIIMGGPHASPFYCGKHIIDNHNVDAVVLHEGDETLPQMLGDFDSTGRFSPIPGLVYKDNGAVIDGGMREPIKSLNDLAFADYSDFDLATYSNPHRLDISSSRSCVNKCHYCDERNYFQRYRFRSGKSLFDEIVFQLAKHSSVEFFNFSDSVLNGSIDAIRDFSELLLAHKVRIKWGGQAVIRKEMTSDLLRLMHEAGCSYLGYGVESGSNRVLTSMNKRLFTVELASEVLKRTHDAKINTYANIMFGYPTETDADFLDTLSFIKRNKDWIDGVSPSQSFTIIVKNTYLHDHCTEFGVEPNPHHLYWKTADGTNTYPVRFARYELFCKLCIDLGLAGVGVSQEKIDKWRLLGGYYEWVQDYSDAFDCYKTDLLQNGYSPDALERYIACSRSANRYDEGQRLISVFDLDKERVKKAAAEDSPQVFSSHKHTDDNWVNGIARAWATALFVSNTIVARKELTVGKVVTFADGTTRKIVKIKEEGESVIVFLSGAPLDGNIVGHPRKFFVTESKS